tara:strand:+ start:4012 stop:4263 length:252 start_codon:yes stop_codon:yes gene_type:complete
MSKRKQTEISIEKFLPEIDKIISSIQEESDYYLNFESIVEDLIESINRNKEGIINRCVECNIDMGRSNPRQLCGKTFCCSEEN